MKGNEDTSPPSVLYMQDPTPMLHKFPELENEDKSKEKNSMSFKKYLTTRYVMALADLVAERHRYWKKPNQGALQLRPFPSLHWPVGFGL